MKADKMKQHKDEIREAATMNVLALGVGNDLLPKKSYALRRAIKAVCGELKAAGTKFPEWPDDLADAYLILAEEFGELGKAILEGKFLHYDGGKIRDEAIQTAAMAIRLLLNLEA